MNIVAVLIVLKSLLRLQSTHKSQVYSQNIFTYLQKLELLFLRVHSKYFISNLLLKNLARLTIRTAVLRGCGSFSMSVLWPFTSGFQINYMSEEHHLFYTEILETSRPTRCKKHRQHLEFWSYKIFAVNLY